MILFFVDGEFGYIEDKPLQGIEVGQEIDHNDQTDPATLPLDVSTHKRQVEKAVQTSWRV